MKQGSFKTYFGIVIMCLLQSACSTSPPSGKPSYYRGHFFDAEVSGQKVIAIQDKAAKSDLKKYMRFSNVRWQLAGKAKNPLNVKPIGNQWTAELLGGLRGREVSIVPLQGQKNKTTTELYRSAGVSINGASSVSSREYLMNNQLPPGAYVIRYKVIGSKNWDRKEIYAEF